VFGSKSTISFEAAPNRALQLFVSSLHRNVRLVAKHLRALASSVRLAVSATN
jgi:hypothetical protein